MGFTPHQNALLAIARNCCGKAISTGIEMLFANGGTAKGLDGFDIAPQVAWALLGADNRNLEQLGNLGSANALIQYRFALIYCGHQTPL
jgi:hypothetical protein